MAVELQIEEGFIDRFVLCRSEAVCDGNTVWVAICTQPQPAVEISSAFRGWYYW